MYTHSGGIGPVPDFQVASSLSRTVTQLSAASEAFAAPDTEGGSKPSVLYTLNGMIAVYVKK